MYTDDVKMGMYLQHTNRYAMRLHPTTVVNTHTPTTIVGPMPNFYNQVSFVRRRTAQDAPQSVSLRARNNCG